MNVTDIIQKYDLDEIAFRNYLVNNNIGKSRLLGDHYIDETKENIGEIVIKFKQFYEEKNTELKELENRILQSAEELRLMQEKLRKILIISGHSFEIYNITKYSGYISADSAIQIDRTGYFSKSDTHKKIEESLVYIRREAIAKLKEQAFDLDCNAIIGIDFDYMMLDPETVGLTGSHIFEPYVLCVTANGTAVKIEEK